MFSRISKNIAMAIKTIGTHNGTFHCDEVLGCSMLKILYPDASIVRSRNMDILNNCDIVIDVGGVFDPDTKRFDHHQRGFNETFHSLDSTKPWEIKLSSAGLVYFHYGRKVLRTLIGDASDSELEALYDKVYDSFVKEVDAIDNGIMMCNEERLYEIRTGISARVSHFNGAWNDDNFDEEEGFKKAMSLVKEEFVDTVMRNKTIWMPARNLVFKFVQERFSFHPSGEIIFLDTFVPWRSHLFDAEKELQVEKPIKYVLFSDKDGSYRVSCVPVNPDSFVLRKPLPEPWRGLREKALCDISKIEGCIFAHMSGFIGGNATKEGALQMAVASLENAS